MIAPPLVAWLSLTVTPLLITSVDEPVNSNTEPTFVVFVVPTIIRSPEPASAPNVKVASYPTLINAVLPSLAAKVSPRLIVISNPSSARIVTDKLT